MAKCALVAKKNFGEKGKETKEEKMSETKIMNWRGFQAVFNKATGHAPYLSNTILYRINRKMATNIVVTGEAGVGKSYFAMDLCRVVEGRTKIGRDRFSLNQVVFTYTDFLNLVLHLKPGKPIVFDEPSYAMGKREWYKELNKALVQTIESFRFKMHPLVIPIINKSLLDRTVREHLIQYQVVLTDRGKGDVYRVKPSQFIDKCYHEWMCAVHYGLFDNELCSKPSCLECPRLTQKNSERYVCTVFRARYERKKASVQDVRYEQAKDLAERAETQQFTMKQIENLSLTIKDRWLLDAHIDVQALRVALEDEYGVRLSNNRAYNLKRRIELHHPELLSL